MALSTQAVDIRQLAAAIFDLDGVITDAATVHAAAWKRLFHQELSRRAPAQTTSRRLLTSFRLLQRHPERRP
ncbi:MAG TPA: hypothetical protein VJ966_17370 [Actinomycetes bacterium]|nr:hypothetical protein [Actinomycetes bacterium]